MNKFEQDDLRKLQSLPLDEKIAIAQEAIHKFVEHFGVDGKFFEDSIFELAAGFAVPAVIEQHGALK